ncbi:MAG: glycerol-3-phosphate 1-O-acyltransferase PlsY [Clostridia bacterium]|nr:glycerol-3-phosphate 1-O-acyltransferase PlsY [Clostridia bacterium]
MEFFQNVIEYFSQEGIAIFKLPLIAVLSYLLGSFNTSIVVSKCFLKKDIRKYGSGNAGFTNAVRSMGIKLAMLVFAGDIGKCAIACLLGQLIYCGNMSFVDGAAGRLLAGAFVFFGHIYPLFFRFKGGKGALTLAVTVAMFDWRIFLIGLAVFLIIVFITKFISLGSIVIGFLFPIAVFVFSRTDLSSLDMSIGYTVIAAIMGGTLIIKHRTNIVRLFKGTESKFSFKGKPLIEGADKVELTKKK